MANYTLDDLQQIAAVEDFLETRACQAAIAVGKEILAGRELGARLDELRRDFADYQAIRSISDIAASRSAEWALHEEARSELRREKLLAHHKTWIQSLQRAVRSEVPNVELLKVIADVAMEIADSVKSFEVSTEEVEVRFNSNLSERNRSRTVT